MKVYIYSQHIIAFIISLGQNMGVQNVILPRGLFFTLFSVLFLSYTHGFLPTRGRKIDYIINMALLHNPCIRGFQVNTHPLKCTWKFIRKNIPFNGQVNIFLCYIYFLTITINTLIHMWHASRLGLSFKYADSQRYQNTKCC